MKLPVLAFGTASLKNKSESIDKDFPELKQLIENMFETMYGSAGVGLAAPQIGKNIRLFIVDTSPFGDDYPDGKDFKRVFINAQITHRTGDEWAFNEGCLCIPEVREDVMRPPTITIKYYDEDFNFHTETYSGIRARVIQHEYDHIEGILFVDRLSPLKKMLIKGKLSAISKGLVATKYKMIYPQLKKQII
ncbi:MAG: peptide deformylase [Bacteroidales bacterium]|jgi:peptide deformylase|nr:peptide deformylase [Bacteroidales bacterium]MDD4214637.1 peptide deformylase [Bacteroidales bacterium]